MNNLESPFSQGRPEASLTALGSPASTDVSTPPTSLFDPDEKHPQRIQTDHHLHRRIRHTLDSITDLAKELDDSRTYVLKSVYISLGKDERSWVSKFCLAVSDVYFDSEFDPASFQDDDAVHYADPDDQFSSGNAMQVRSECTQGQSPSFRSGRETFQSGFTDVFEPSQSDTFSEAESFQYSGSMQDLQSEVPEKACSVTKSRAATASQQADLRRIPTVGTATSRIEFLVNHVETPKKPISASDITKADRIITPAAAQEILNAQENTKASTTSRALNEEVICAKPLSSRKYENYCQLLEHKSIKEFIETAHNGLRSFATCTDDRNLSQLSHGWQQEPSICSDGSMLLELLESAYGYSRFATIKYVFTAMHAAKWFNNKKSPPADHPHASKPAMKSSNILDLMTGPRPEDDRLYSYWEKKRKRCSTHLARGRKWLRLVEKFHRGILFMDVWKIAKCDEASIDRLTVALDQDRSKTLALRVLDQQMQNLLVRGRTTPGEFLPCLLEEASNDNIELDIEPDLKAGPSCSHIVSEAERPLICDVEAMISNQTLVVIGTKPKVMLNPESIHSIDPDKSKRGGVPHGWIDSNVILVCMHLLYKLPGVKIGWSIEIHQHGNGKPVYKPFNKAINELKKWRKESTQEVNMVSFFPLFLNNNHFSLLEINEGTKCLYHYDSLPSTASSDVRQACTLQFPNYAYIEADTLLQEDHHSCGPLVIYAARKRMAGFCVKPDSCGDNFANKIREDILCLLKRGLENGILVPHDSKRRRNGMSQDEVQTQAKKQKCEI